MIEATKDSGNITETEQMSQQQLTLLLPFCPSLLLGYFFFSSPLPHLPDTSLPV